MKYLPNAPKPTRLMLLTTRIVLVYLVVGALWILVTDRLVDALVTDDALRSFLQTIKGWLYIAANALLLYWLIHRSATGLLKAEKALRESSERYRQMFERNRAIQLIVDSTDGRIIDANQSAADFYGYPLDRLLGMNIAHLSTLTREESLAEMERARQEERTYFRYKDRLASGEIRDIEVYSGPISFDGQTYLYSIVHDISMRRQAEEALRRQNEELAALHETTLGIINRLDHDSLLEAIVNRASSLLDTPHVFVCVVKENEQGEKYLLMPAGSGFFSEEVGRPLPFGDGLTEQVWRTAETIKVDDYSRWRGRRPTLDYMPIHAALSVPLMVGEEVVGVLGMAYVEPDRSISAEEVALFERLAKLASLALQNARLYAAAQQELAERMKVQKALVRHNEELVALHDIALGILNRPDPESLLETLVSKAAALLDTPHAYLYLVEPGNDRISEPHLAIRIGTGSFGTKAGYKLRRGEGIAGRVWQTGQVLAVDDYHTWSGRRKDFDYMAIQGIAGIPLQVGSEVIGVIGVAFFDQGRKVGPDEVALLERFAKLASLALQNARLYAAAQQELEERVKTERNLQESAAAQTQLLAQLLTAQEAERRRLSMEIHDGPLQSLGVSLLALDRALRRYERGDHEEAGSELHYVRDTIVGIVEEVRGILSVLSLEILNTYGLTSALHDHLDRFSEITGIESTVKNELRTRLPAYIELLMYRLAQESLANIRKHSGASRAEIALSIEDNNLVMSITDNGKGFNLNEAMRKERAGEKIGLQSMHQRIREARGEMVIKSSANRGTSITFTCPIPHNELHIDSEPAELMAHERQTSEV
ncbi:MAG: GAF domain-containing protein [Chloroflexia bacterium]